MAVAVGTDDVLFLTFDTLRFDVAQQALQAGELPVLAAHIDSFEERDSPGTFTYAAHASFFAGFLPTPRSRGPHLRELALAFGGATTIGPDTAVFDAPDLPRGFANAGYRTACIGGTGFFNPATALGRDLPSRFQEAFWEPKFGVTEVRSPQHQVAKAMDWLDAVGEDRVFLFINLSAMHQPNHHYIEGTVSDDVHTQRAALGATVAALEPLFQTFERRSAPTQVFAMSDHGTLYGEEGRTGHRCAHPLVTTVPYARFVL